MPMDVTFYGGGGLAASAAEYPRFTQYGSTRANTATSAFGAIHRQADDLECSAARMSAYADIARPMGDIGPAPEMGRGFGLGPAVQYRGGAVLARSRTPAFANNASTSTCSEAANGTADH
jgi:hypothetical protein